MENTTPHARSPELTRFQATLVDYFDRACGYAESQRRRLCLQPSDAEDAVGHAFERLAAALDGLENVWAWLRRVIKNFLLSRLRHARMAEKRVETLNVLASAAHERQQAFYGPMSRAIRREQEELLRRFADEFKALRPNPVRSAVVDALMRDDYNAGALAREFGCKVQWISMLKKEFTEFKQEYVRKNFFVDLLAA